MKSNTEYRTKRNEFKKTLTSLPGFPNDYMLSEFLSVEDYKTLVDFSKPVFQS